MGSIAGEIIFIFLLLLLNGVLAMAEIAIISVRKVRLHNLADDGNRRAQIALDLAADPNNFLATVQIGITLVGILAGALGGATIAKEIAALLSWVPYIGVYGEGIGIGVVTIVITYFSLVLGELVPKRLGMSYAESIAIGMAGSLRMLSNLSSPLVRLLSLSTDLVLTLLGFRPSTEPSITSEELKVLVEQGTETGVFEASEQDMIEGILRLDERRIEAFMIPRTQIVAFDIDESHQEIRQKISEYPYTYYPVIKNSMDNPLGIIDIQDMFIQSLDGQPFDLKSVLRKPLYVPESMSALRVLELFRQVHTHVALIVDEYGGLQGMVTLNNILDEIVGAIPSIESDVTSEIIHRDDGSWLVDGQLHIDELKEALDIQQLPNEERGYYQTVGGFMMTQLGHIPVTGQGFEWAGLYFEVVDMDGFRVDKVLILRNPSCL
ncbi:MAG: hemolysin family protein [Caldilineaceae bacterium]|nr:hemolysin family protein [Caldilineaceae bacterium]HRJ42850.1 hemolysin family protein [Caldilineaceae bacterium]